MAHLPPAETGRTGPAVAGSFSSILYSTRTLAGMILAACLVVFYLTTQIERVPPGLAQGIQPASYPQGVVAFVVLFTFLMLFEARNAPLDVPEPIPSLAYLTAAAMILSLAISTWIDFFGGLIAFVVVCVPLWGMRRYGVAILYALALHAALFVLFSTFLHVRFPRGVLSNLLN